MRILATWIVLLVTAFVLSSGTIIVQGAGGTHTFTPLTLYFISPSGNDACNGLSTAIGSSGTCAWASPNHAVNCGDVILAGPGTYTSTFVSWGTVSNCPSTSGGIDGNGGIYFATLLCAGVDLEACLMSVNTGGPDAMGINANNWAVEGWKLTNPTGDGYIMEAIAGCPATCTTQIHHIAFVNDICYNSQMGFQGDEGGFNQNVPGNGVDYYAYVGLLAQNCAQSGFGVAGINIVAPSSWDNLPGTHIFANGNFSISSTNNGNQTDGEAYQFDSFDAHGYPNKVVFSNNVGFNSQRNCIQFTYHSSNSSAPPIYVYNNTCYGNITGSTVVGSDGVDGEINIAALNGVLPWIINIYNNVAAARYATAPIGANATPIFASAYENFAGPTTGWGANIHSGDLGANVFFGIFGACQGGGVCDAGFNVIARDSSVVSTFDTYSNPSFKNTTDLITNHIGVPNCSNTTNVTWCMGWRGSVIAKSVIDDLIPTAGGTAGKGYQVPGPCSPNLDYPKWLKGMVYLTADGYRVGAVITENEGLITRPCDM